MKDATFLNKISAVLDEGNCDLSLSFKASHAKRLYQLAHENLAELPTTDVEVVLPYSRVQQLVKNARFWLRQLPLPGIL